MSVSAGFVWTPEKDVDGKITPASRAELPLWHVVAMTGITPNLLVQRHEEAVAPRGLGSAMLSLTAPPDGAQRLKEWCEGVLHKGVRIAMYDQGGHNTRWLAGDAYDAELGDWVVDIPAVNPTPADIYYTHGEEFRTESNHGSYHRTTDGTNDWMGDMPGYLCPDVDAAVPRESGGGVRGVDTHGYGASDYSPDLQAVVMAKGICRFFYDADHPTKPSHFEWAYFSYNGVRMDPGENTYLAYDDVNQIFIGVIVTTAEAQGATGAVWRYFDPLERDGNGMIPIRDHVAGTNGMTYSAKVGITKMLRPGGAKEWMVRFADVRNGGGDSAMVWNVASQTWKTARTAVTGNAWPDSTNSVEREMFGHAYIDTADRCIYIAHGSGIHGQWSLLNPDTFEATTIALPGFNAEWSSTDQVGRKMVYMPALGELVVVTPQDGFSETFGAAKSRNCAFHIRTGSLAELETALAPSEPEPEPEPEEGGMPYTVQYSTDTIYPDNTALTDIDAGWSYPVGTYPRIKSNVIADTGGCGGASLVTVEGEHNALDAFADGAVEATLKRVDGTPSGSHYPGMFFRYQDADNYVAIRHTYNGSLYTYDLIAKSTAGGFVSLWSASAPSFSAAGTKLRAEFTGDQVAVFINDSLVTTETVPVTAAGKVRIRASARFGCYLGWTDLSFESLNEVASTPPTIGTVTGVSLTPTTARITVPVSFA